MEIPPDQLAEIDAHLLAHWQGRTLADLRAEALADHDGIAFESLSMDGRRMFVVACLSSDEARAKLPPAPPESEVETSDWAAESLFSVLFMAGEGDGVYFATDRGEFPHRNSVALIAAGPFSSEMLIGLLASLFGR